MGRHKKVSDWASHALAKAGPDRCSSHASVTATCEQSRPKQGEGKTKQATLISDFHAYGSKSSLWPIRLARS